MFLNNWHRWVSLIYFFDRDPLIFLISPSSLSATHHQGPSIFNFKMLLIYVYSSIYLSYLMLNSYFSSRLWVCSLLIRSDQPPCSFCHWFPLRWPPKWLDPILIPCPWVTSRTCDLLLTKTVWHRQLMSLAITLHTLRLHFSRLERQRLSCLSWKRQQLSTEYLYWRWCNL